jgi:hypothetical protein
MFDIMRVNSFKQTASKGGLSVRTHRTRFWKTGGIAESHAGIVDANRAQPPPPNSAAKHRKIALTIFGLAIAVCQAGTTIRARAAPVQFLQICGESSSFIIPGTNTCVDANQIVANQIGTARQASTAFTGIAMSEALVAPFVPDHANFAVSIHEASFENKFAVGLSGLLRLQGNLMLSVGIAVGRDSGSVVTGETTPSPTGQQSLVQTWDQFYALGRMGLTYSW